jgi:hypothetical protein
VKKAKAVKNQKHKGPDLGKSSGDAAKPRAKGLDNPGSGAACDTSHYES